MKGTRRWTAAAGVFVGQQQSGLTRVDLPPPNAATRSFIPFLLPFLSSSPVISSHTTIYDQVTLNLRVVFNTAASLQHRVKDLFHITLHMKLQGNQSSGERVYFIIDTVRFKLFKVWVGMIFLDELSVQSKEEYLANKPIQPES